MNNCGLKSLNHFPALKNLITLELNENEFPVRELLHLKGLASLKALDIDNLEIEGLNQLEPLKDLKKLERLELNDCELLEEEENRQKVFKMLPSLQVLNGMDKEGNDVDYSDEEMSEDEESEEDSEEEDEESDDEESEEESEVVSEDD